MRRGGRRGSRKTWRKQACPSQTMHGKQFSKQVPEGKDVAGRGNAEGADWEKKLRMNKGADYPVLLTLLARALLFWTSSTDIIQKLARNAVSGPPALLHINRIPGSGLGLLEGLGLWELGRAAGGRPMELQPQAEGQLFQKNVFFKCGLRSYLWGPRRLNHCRRVGRFSVSRLLQALGPHGPFCWPSLQTARLACWLLSQHIPDDLIDCRLGA